MFLRQCLLELRATKSEVDLMDACDDIADLGVHLRAGHGSGGDGVTQITDGTALLRQVGDNAGQQGATTASSAAAVLLR
jgi:hypothetical protein